MHDDHEFDPVAEAERLHNERGIDRLRALPVLEDLARHEWMEPIRPGGENPLSDAARILGADAALGLFEEEGVEDVLNRFFLFDLLISPVAPLTALADLGASLSDFAVHRRTQAEWLVRTGFPLRGFRRMPWLDINLGLLYPARERWVMLGMLHSDEPTDNCPACQSSDDGEHRLPHWDFDEVVDGLSSEAESQLPALRERLLGLSSDVVEQLAAAVDARSEDGLMGSVLSTLIDDGGLLKADVDEFLRLDRLYVGDDIRSGEPRRAEGYVAGGLTDLLQVAIHCACELRTGRLAATSARVRELTQGQMPHAPSTTYFNLLHDDIADGWDAIIDELLAAEDEYAAARRTCVRQVRQGFESRLMVPLDLPPVLVTIEDARRLHNQGAAYSSHIEQHVRRGGDLTELIHPGRGGARRGAREELPASVVTPVPLPDGVAWRDVLLHLGDRDLTVRSRGEEWHRDLGDSGFADGRKDGNAPGESWTLLRLFAVGSGFLEPAALREGADQLVAAVRKRGGLKDPVYRLNKRLRTLFPSLGSAEQPIRSVGTAGTYECRFPIETEEGLYFPVPRGARWQDVQLALAADGRLVVTLLAAEVLAREQQLLLEPRSSECGAIELPNGDVTRTYSLRMLGLEDAAGSLSCAGRLLREVIESGGTFERPATDAIDYDEWTDEAMELVAWLRGFLAVEGDPFATLTSTGSLRSAFLCRDTLGTSAVIDD